MCVGAQAAPFPPANLGSTYTVYAVPQQGAATIPGTWYTSAGKVTGSLAPGKPYAATYVGGVYELVSVKTYVGTFLSNRKNFWVVPDYVKTKDVAVTVDGVTTPFGSSAIAGLTTSVAQFDDPATSSYEGWSRDIRDFLSCRTSWWDLGGYQRFNADLIHAGIVKNDTDLIDKGIIGLDNGWKTQRADGSFALKNACGVLAESRLKSHSVAFFMEAVERASFELAASRYAGSYRAKIDSWTPRLALAADNLVLPARWSELLTRMSVYNHRRFLDAAAFTGAAQLAQSARWDDKISYLVSEGLAMQWVNGVFPENGGYDMGYHQASLRYIISLLSLRPDSPLAPALIAAENKGISQSVAHLDPVTGAADLSDSTRMCHDQAGPDSGEIKNWSPGTMTGVFVYWGGKYYRRSLIDKAVLAHQAYAAGLSGCP